MSALSSANHSQILSIDLAPQLYCIRPEILIYRRRPQKERVRKVFDSILAGSALILTSPILVAAACAVYLEDRGPMFFTQERVGRFGKPFTIYKLRTMRVTDLSDKPSPKSANDSRITRIGRILRKTSIDELPQLFNVAKGEMAIVGPRPEMPFIVRSYESWQHLRHLVTPGLTGLWQVKARKTISLERPEATMIDIDYIRTSTTLLDIAIIAQTVKAVVRQRGAY